jgi:hypothetical protein
MEGAVVVLGLTLAHFTALHAAISMVAILAGFVVIGGLFSNAGLAGWTAFFLLMTILTTATGFLFPLHVVTPALITGILSALILIVSLVALYGYRLAGGWRLVYVVTALIALYLNVFVLIVQSFRSVSFLHSLAPTGSEPPFLITQIVALVAFVAIGIVAARRYHGPARLVAR